MTIQMDSANKQSEEDRERSPAIAAREASPVISPQVAHSPSLDRLLQTPRSALYYRPISVPFHE